MTACGERSRRVYGLALASILRMCLWLFLCVCKGYSKETLRAGGGCVFQGYRRVSVFTGRVGWCEAVDLGLES